MHDMKCIYRRKPKLSENLTKATSLYINVSVIGVENCEIGRKQFRSFQKNYVKVYLNCKNCDSFGKCLIALYQILLRKTKIGGIYNWSA